jgi:bifunctional DNase/RNase
MYVKTEYLSKIRQNNIDTYYIYSKQEKMILPLDLPIEQNIYPPTSDCMRRIIALFESKVSLIKIYGERDSEFYTYVSLVKSGQIYDISICLRDALQMTEQLKCPIFVKRNILYRTGIRVTKKLLEEALS